MCDFFSKHNVVQVKIISVALSKLLKQIIILTYIFQMAFYKFNAKGSRMDISFQMYLNCRD